jgi:putative ABC transport system permease protein
MAGSHSARASENLIAFQVQPFAFIVVLTMIMLKAMIQKSKSQTNNHANLAGLAIGMAVAILIALWVYDDVSHNRRLKNHGHITDVYERQTEPSEPKEQPANGLQQSLAKVLQKKSSALDSLIRLAQLIENKVVDMFSLKILAVRTQLFDDPRAIIIPETPVSNPFRNKAPFNYVVKLNHKMEVRVSGAFLTFLPPDGALE